jgi:hypothetical protein
LGEAGFALFPAEAGDSERWKEKKHVDVYIYRKRQDKTMLITRCMKVVKKWVKNNGASALQIVFP